MKLKALPKPPVLRFTEAESIDAEGDWGAACGPQAIAAAINEPLEHVRENLPAGFRGSMSPTQVKRTLDAFAIVYRQVKELQDQKLRNGLGYVQWDGRWVMSKFRQERYHYTHWIAARNGWVFDLNAIQFGWLYEADWRMDISRFVKDEGYKGWFFWQWFEL
jgi:hypothetical protein